MTLAGISFPSPCPASQSIFSVTVICSETVLWKTDKLNFSIHAGLSCSEVNNIIRWINLYQVNNTISFPNTSPEDSAIQRLTNQGQKLPHF